MYWKANVRITENSYNSAQDILTYYGYIDENQYDNYFNEIADEVFLCVQENIDEYSYLFNMDEDTILSKASIEIKEISKEFYDQKTSY